MVFLMLTLLPGCVKTKPKQVATAPLQVRVVPLLGNVDEDEIQLLPKRTLDAIGQALADRNITWAADSAIDPAFGARRTWPARTKLLEQIENPVLLVGCEAQYDTQVNGRFRWEVTCNVALDGEGNFSEGKTSSSSHLVYYHQREDEAVMDVQAGLVREVGQVVDQWLATRQP